MKIPHGTLTGTADGRRLYEVFAPGWRLWLWLGWWLGRGRAKGVVTFFDQQGNEYRVRVRESRVVLPRVGACESDPKPAGSSPTPRT